MGFYTAGRSSLAFRWKMGQIGKIIPQSGEKVQNVNYDRPDLCIKKCQVIPAALLFCICLNESV